MFLNKVEMNDNESRINIKMHTVSLENSYLPYLFFHIPHFFLINKRKLFFNLHILHEYLSCIRQVRKWKFPIPYLLCTASYTYIKKLLLEKKMSSASYNIAFHSFFLNPFCVLSYFMPKGEMKRCCWHPEGLLTWKYFIGT